MMWSLFKMLVVRGLVARAAAWLIWMIPLGFLLKWVGLPLLVVVTVLGVLVPAVLLYRISRWLMRTPTPTPEGSPAPRGS